MRFFKEDNPWNQGPLLCSIDSLPQMMPFITGGTAAAGTVGNIMEEQKKMAYQNYITNLMKNPGQLAAMISKLQQPLNQGLTQAVGNQVQGNMAERGLSQAPGIFAATESQALAPYYQQNQNTAMQSLMQMLGMPAGTFGQPVNTSGAMSMFMQSLKNQPGGGGGGGTGNMGTPPTFPGDVGGGGGTYTPTTFDPNSPWLTGDFSGGVNG
jgi:hypothetical protein